METQTQTEPTQQAETPAVSSPVQDTTSDPFHFDESALSQLTPESRTAIEPLIQSWKKSALETITKTKESYKSAEEKAQALDKLVKDENFVSWYNQTYNRQTTPADEVEETSGEEDVRKPIVTPQEWNEALQLAANGDPTKYEELNRRIAEAATLPALTEIQKKQNEMKMSIELDNVFRNHPDVRELDSIKVNDSPGAPSLFEMALYYVHDRNGRSMEEAYGAAKNLYNNIMAQAKKSAMGMLQEKKTSVTEGPTTSTNESSVIYVDSPEQVLREQIKANMAGKKAQVMLRKK